MTLRFVNKSSLDSRNFHSARIKSSSGFASVSPPLQRTDHAEHQVFFYPI